MHIVCDCEELVLSVCIVLRWNPKRSRPPIRRTQPQPLQESSLLYTGRPRQSPVWNFFLFNAAKSRSVCKVQIRVVDSTTKLCGIQISGKYPTNLKAHLRTAHPQVFAEVSTAVCVVYVCVHCAVCVCMCMSTVTNLSLVLS